MLPPVYSTTEPPGLRRPSASAASIMASAIRSFMLPVGFSFSSFSRMRAPLAGRIWRRAIRDVLPMRSRMVRGWSVMGSVRKRSILDRPGSAPAVRSGIRTSPRLTAMIALRPWQITVSSVPWPAPMRPSAGAGPFSWCASSCAAAGASTTSAAASRASPAPCSRSACRIWCMWGPSTRIEGEHGPEYALTEAGRELMGIVGALGTWGQRWLPRQAGAEDLDLEPVLVDMQRRVRLGGAAARTPSSSASRSRGSASRASCCSRRRRSRSAPRTRAFPSRSAFGPACPRWSPGGGATSSFAEAQRMGLTVEGPRGAGAGVSGLVRAVPVR